MKLKKCGAALALSVLTSTAMADYRVDLDAVYADLGDDAEGKAVSGRFHFNTVETDSHPLAEAAFLERANSISLAHIQQEIFIVDFKDTHAILELYVPQAMLYIAPFYVKSRAESPYGQQSANDWGATIGITPIEGIRISTTWSDESDYELNLAMKYVMNIGDTKAVNLELHFQEASDEEFEADDTLGLGLDFYFDRTFSIGAEIRNQEDTAFGIRTRKFFTEQFSLAAGYLTVREQDAWSIGASLRF